MKKYLVLLFSLLWINTSDAASFFAVGTGNWSGASTVWATSSGGVAALTTPTSADTCTFDLHSTGTVTVAGTIASPDNCGTVTMTAPGAGTILMATGKGLNIAGSMTLASGMTFAPSQTSLLKFTSTATGKTVTSAGYRLGNITFDGIGGGWTLQDALNPTTSGIVTLTNGALNTNSVAVGATSGAQLSSSNSNTRSLTLGTTTWTLPNTSIVTLWDITNSTGMALSAGSSTLTSLLTNANATFAGGGLAYGAVSFPILTFGTVTFTGANTFGGLTLAGGNLSASTTINSGYFLSANQIVTGTFTSTGNSLTARTFIASDTIGTPRTISAGTFAITNTDLRDITKAGAGSGDISATSATTGNGDCGGNTGWTFQAPRNVYMKTAVSVNWSAANWFTASGGSTAAVPPLPLCHDTAIFDANSVTVAAKTITVNMPRLAGFDWTGVANTPAFATGTGGEFEIYGSAVLVSGMTRTGTALTDLTGRGSFLLDGGGLTWPTSANLTVNAGTGTYSLARDLTSNAGLVVASGTLSGNGHVFSVTTYSQTGGTDTLGGTMTLNSTNAISGGTFNTNGHGVTGYTTLAVSGGIVNLDAQLNGSAGITLSGGTTNDSGNSGEYKGTTLSCTGGTHTLRKLTLSSTFAASATCAYTLPAGANGTYATSWNESNISGSTTVNGRLVRASGSYTVSGNSCTFGD